MYKIEVRQDIFICSKGDSSREVPLFVAVLIAAYVFRMPTCLRENCAIYTSVLFLVEDFPGVKMSRILLSRGW